MHAAAPDASPDRRPGKPAAGDGAASGARRGEVARALAELLPSDCLLSRDEELRPYECDGLAAYRQQPMLVALPRTESQVCAVVRTCHRLGVPLVARGAGTGLSGGALPHAAGVLLSLARLDRILDVDPLARTARVQPGVRNLAVSEAAAPFGLYYAP
ncbi:MAG TPA: FAD-binding protein, partial [Steroidobacteraceae bacterium]